MDGGVVVDGPASAVRCRRKDLRTAVANVEVPPSLSIPSTTPTGACAELRDPLAPKAAVGGVVAVVDGSVSAFRRLRRGRRSVELILWLAVRSTEMHYR